MNMKTIILNLIMKTTYHQRDLYEESNEKNDTFIWKKHENLGYSPHFHSAVEIYFLLDGSMEAEINGKRFKMESGDISIANPFEIHKYYKTDPAHVCVLIFSDRYLEDFRAEFKDNTLKTHLTDKTYNTQILDILKDIPFSFSESNLSTLARKAYVNLLLDRIISRYGLETPTVSHSQILEIVTYIYKNYRQKITLDTLAKEFGYTKTSMSRLLSKYLQIDLRYFLNNLRAEQAELLLRNPKYENYSILEISSLCGFDSVVTFYRAYKRRFGHSPRS